MPTLTTREQYLVNTYGAQITPTDTPATAAERLQIGRQFARKVMAACRKAGVVPASRNAAPKHPQATKAPAEPATPTMPEYDTLEEAKAAVKASMDEGASVEDGGLSLSSDVNDVIRTPEEYIASIGLDLNVWQVVAARPSTSSVCLRGRRVTHDDGTVVDLPPEIIRLYHCRLNLKPRVFPVCPALGWLPPPPYLATDRMRHGDTKRAVIIPDIHFGYVWRFEDRGAWLEPTHDRVALDCVLQMVSLAEPTHIRILGDLLDLATISRWPSEDAQRQAMAFLVREAAWFLWRLREVAGPDCDILYHMGNHEARLEKFVQSNAAELKTLMNSIPTVLGLDTLNIQTVEYPNRSWLWGDIGVGHGTSTAPGQRRLQGAAYSWVQGHDHRASVTWRTIAAPEGMRRIFDMSCGYLGRTGGVLPGSTEESDWQQAVGEITSGEGLTPVPAVHLIENGRMLYRGDVLAGVDYTESLVQSSGITLFRKP